MRSIRAQLNIGLVLSLVVLFFLQWLLVSVSIRHLAEHYVASRLAHDGESLLAALNLPADGKPLLDSARIDAIYHRPFSGHYFQVAVAGHVLHSRSLWDQNLALTELPPGTNRLDHGAGPQRQRLLIRGAGYRKQGHSVTITVAEDLAPVDVGLRSFQWRYAGLTLMVLVILLMVQRRVVLAGLQPLEHARRDLHALERGGLQALDADVPEEMRPLVEQINRLLQVMSLRLTRSRHALGNLAHALKTPLTLLNQLVGHAALRDCPEAREQLRAQTDALQAIAERELKRARLAGAGRSGQRVEIAPELTALLDTLRHLHRDKTLEFDVRISADASFVGDREDLLELLGNLLDNACKWAARRVRVVVESDNGLRLCIEDDGPGCLPPQLEQLAQRGVRLDERVTGHGLGLSIAREIVEQYGGTLRLRRSDDLGGFMAEVQIMDVTGDGGAGFRKP